MKSILGLLLTLLVFASAQAEESRYTLADCSFTNAQLNDAFRDKLATFFVSLQSPLAPESVQVVDAVLEASHFSFQFAVAKTITFQTQSGSHLALENFAAHGSATPDITSGSVVIERGILETYSPVGELSGRFCVWSLPDSGSGVVLKNTGTQRSLLEITDKFIGGLTGRYTQPFVILKAALP